MAIRLVDRYPNRTQPASSDYPHGAGRNRTDATADGGEVASPEVEDVDAEIIDHTETVDEQETEIVESDIEQLSKNPIDFLKQVNNDFVYTKKGKQAISKQGFRFIQREFGITTESEVVHTFEEPRGIVVWAKATLPDGHSAEAHGEGYVTEKGVEKNEFVRYADTRAKNRALSDLTSAGALAVSELEN